MIKYHKFRARKILKILLVQWAANNKTLVAPKYVHLSPKLKFCSITDKANIHGCPLGSLNVSFTCPLKIIGCPGQPGRF